MKKIIYGIMIAGAALAASCSDFLTEKPRTAFSPTQVYATEEGAQAALNGCYAYLSNSLLYGQKLHILLSGHAGTMTIGNTQSQYLVDISSMDVQTNNSAVEDVYTGSFQTINALNDLLISLPPESIDPDAKQRMLGEAHFMRALVYFNLVRIVGPVPLVLAPGTSFAELHRPRTPINEIYGAILEDLNEAWNMLPEPGDQPYGRPHKYAARTLLAKVYVAMACIKTHPGEPFDASWLTQPAGDYWQAAYDAASDVEQHSQYGLVSDFARLWDCYNRYTVESIFELEENQITGSCSFMYHYLPGFWEAMPTTTSNNNYGRIRALRESWDEHYNRYYDAALKQGDYRLDVTYLDSLFKRNMVVSTNPGGTYYTYPYTLTNIPPGQTAMPSRSEELPYVKKYLDSRFSAGDANVNVIVLRYADLLLTLAEAANELGNTPEAVGYMNRLMYRARFTPEGRRQVPADWALDMSQADFRTNLQIERRLELKGELHEWFDNRRFGKDEFKKIIVNHNNRLKAFPIKESTGEPEIMTYDYYWSEKDADVLKNMLCPFPMAEITANNNITEADQNRGY